MGKVLIQVYDGKWITVAKTNKVASQVTANAYQTAKNGFDKVRIRKDGRTLVNWAYGKVRTKY